jgi:PAS domain S-box-containing protein
MPGRISKSITIKATLEFVIMSADRAVPHNQRNDMEGWARALFDGIDDAVFVHDLEGRILEANPAACRRLQYTREELLRLTTRDIDDPQFAAGYQERLRTQLAAGRLRCEGRHRTKNGQLVPVDVNTSAIQFQGKPAVLAVVRDITQRKQAEEALERQKHLLQSILDHMGEAVIVADPEFNILVSNPAAQRLFGLSAAGGGPLSNRLFLPDSVTPFPVNDLPLRRAMRGEEVNDVEMWVRQPGASEGLWVSVSGRSLRDARGAVRGGILVGREITERRRADDELRNMSRFLDSIIQSLPIMLFVKDAQDLRFERFNKTAEELLGYRAQDLIGKNDYDFFPKEEADFFTTRDREVLQSKKLLDIAEEVIDTRHGQRILHTRKIPIVDEDGTPRHLVGISEDITERKRAERRLKAQYAVARALADAQSVEDCARKVLQVLCEGLTCDMGVLWLVNRQENVLRCLDSWRQPGVAAPEFEAMTRRIAFAPGIGLPGVVWQTGAPSVLHDLGVAPNFPRAPAAARDGLQVGFGFPITCGGETTGVIEFFNRTKVRPDEDMLAMMASLGSQIGQIVERQHIEQALRDSESLYHSLVECLPQNIFRKDRNGHITFANHRYAATLNRPLRELIGLTDFDLFPRDVAAKYVRDDQHVMDSSVTLEAVEEHFLPDGTKLYVQVVKTPVHDAQGEVVGIQGIFWDVTERKRAEEAVKDSERRYRQLTEATQDGIIVVDPEGLITLFNPAAQRMFGYSEAEAVGQPITFLMPPEYQELHRRGFRRYLQTRQPRVIGRIVELQAMRKDGTEFPIELALSVLTLGPPGPDGRAPIHFLGALRDLTERNRMRSVVIQNEKLASIGLLSAGVAHEINNPLAFVANNLVVLERDLKGLMALVELFVGRLDRLAQADPESAAQARQLMEDVDLSYLQENLPRLLGRTREGVDRVTRIVHSLRGLARTDSPKRLDTYLPDLVDSSLEILRGRLKRSNIEIVQEHEPSPRFRCVPTQVNQVLVNLLVNAAQAIEATRRTDGRIRVRTCPLDEEILLEVADNGCGIDAAHMARIFDPFFTTKDVGEGTGLGLSISHNIVMAHGGRMEVDSRPGEGSTFRVYLPLKPPRELA